MAETPMLELVTVSSTDDPNPPGCARGGSPLGLELVSDSLLELAMLEGANIIGTAGGGG